MDIIHVTLINLTYYVIFNFTCYLMFTTLTILKLFIIYENSKMFNMWKKKRAELNESLVTMFFQIAKKINT